MSEARSQRQLLFSRVQKQKIAESLAKNVEKLARAQEKLQNSRLSSESSSASINSLRRAYSTASHQKSNSKQKLLKEIIEKLREARPSRSPMMKRAEEEGRASEGAGGSSPRKSGNRINKLEEMMKEIKKCNQMSTKAVYSIKKNINERLSSATRNKQDKSSPRILLLVNEMAALKQELLNIKQENKQLIDIIQKRDKECQQCSCHCHFSK